MDVPEALLLIEIIRADFLEDLQRLQDMIAGNSVSGNVQSDEPAEKIAAIPGPGSPTADHPAVEYAKKRAEELGLPEPEAPEPVSEEPVSEEDRRVQHMVEQADSRASASRAAARAGGYNGHWGPSI